MASKDNNLHAGHRERMYKQYDVSQFEGMYDHQILEMMLFHVIKMSDTNAIAHRLLDKFETLSNVFHAPTQKLASVEGVGLKVARYLNMIGGTIDASLRTVDMSRLSPKTSREFFKTLFQGKHREVFYIICLDLDNNVLCSRILNEGGFQSTEVDIGKAIKVALDFNCPQVVFAHNHPSGILKASDADLTVTSMLESGMHLVGVKLRDHIIYANGDCLSIMNNYKIRKDRSFENWCNSQDGLL